MKPAQPFPLKGDGPETRKLITLVDAGEEAADQFELEHGYLFGVERDDDELRGKLADARYRDWRRQQIRLVKS